MIIENIVSSGSFNQTLDLGLLSAECPFIEYDVKKYHGAYIKVNNHSVTIYRSGKYIMPGIKTIEITRHL